MAEFLHFDIQSTGQKSHRVDTVARPPRCYVLIKQSDSPSHCQFRVRRSRPLFGRPPRQGGRRRPLASTPRPPGSPAGKPETGRRARAGRGPRRPDARSQSFSRSYGSVLPTSLTHIVLRARGCSPRRPAAVMSTNGGRASAGIASGPSSPGFSRTLDGTPDAAGSATLYRARRPLSGPSDSRAVVDALTRKDNSLRGRRGRLRVRGASPRDAPSGSGMLTRFPFDGRGLCRGPRFDRGAVPCLRIDSPTSNCCSHGTFLHFGLQSSGLNICYYHRDLHRGPFRPGSRTDLLHDPRALLLLAPCFFHGR